MAITSTIMGLVRNSEGGKKVSGVLYETNILHKMAAYMC